ncbi:MAG TPA: hypothetical protein P5275_17035 [Saprospiraceae bacterium]|nr:hypothetical protein [Saprospiraceae bacterium]MCB9271669.1 hypothetical protein [Lewinellaceae bacterium]HPG09010.1 hypothetical protein [Saprospiraceae bacterium]HQU54659.1 hypothetical protein [Saprospiraceae bacterium]HRV86582.1 hypothetical protein [Saprospiraceae bacterium]
MSNQSCSPVSYRNNSCLWAYGGVFTLFLSEWVRVGYPWQSLITLAGIALIAFAVFQQIRSRNKGCYRP